MEAQGREPHGTGLQTGVACSKKHSTFWAFIAFFCSPRREFISHHIEFPVSRGHFRRCKPGQEPKDFRDSLARQHAIEVHNQCVSIVFALRYGRPRHCASLSSFFSVRKSVHHIQGPPGMNVTTFFANRSNGRKTHLLIVTRLDCEADVHVRDEVPKRDLLNLSPHGDCSHSPQSRQLG